MVLGLFLTTCSEVTPWLCLYSVVRRIQTWVSGIARQHCNCCTIKEGPISWLSMYFFWVWGSHPTLDPCRLFWVFSDTPTAQGSLLQDWGTYGVLGIEPQLTACKASPAHCTNSIPCAFQFKKLANTTLESI